MKTVLITRCSSGYGLETARHFHAQGWNVIATMRTPREGILPRSDRMRVLTLDVTKPERIDADVDGARGVRDQHLRRHGDDAGRAAPNACAEVGGGGERDIKCNADADA